MNKKQYKYLVYLTSFCFIDIHGISVVYNLRIAEITRRQALDPKFADPSIALIALLNQSRQRVDCVKENITSNLGTYMYIGKNIYFKTDFAWGHVQARHRNHRFSRTQTDDILFTLGYSKSITKQTKLTVSMLLGIPTHEDKILEGIQLGTGHNGLGIQCDGSFIINAYRTQSILGAIRYIRFLPASTKIFVQNDCRHYELGIGNLVDLIIGYNYLFGTSVIECGYNASFLFSASIEPALESLSNGLNYIRSNFYTAYKRVFLREKHSQGIVLAISYGFDNKPNIFKRIFTIWVGWGINF
jgi:hypothetical protein